MNKSDTIFYILYSMTMRADYLNAIVNPLLKECHAIGINYLQALSA